ATARQLSPDDVLELVNRFKRLQSRDRRATPAYLYRWITGESDPPTDDDGHNATAANPSAASIPRARDLMTERTELEVIRSSVIKSGRQSRLDADAMRSVMREAFAKRGFDPEEVPPEFLELNVYPWVVPAERPVLHGSTL
ncbi:MAG: hypothetical protein AAFV88_25065, partial [Planctomycetota bacterium]